MSGIIALLTALAVLAGGVLAWYVNRDKRTKIQKILDEAERRKKDRRRLIGSDKGLADYDQRQRIKFLLRNKGRRGKMVTKG